ncbi:Ankyrin repeat and sterile alpha motif domain-containing protein 1B [Symbiodinium microadriaticum]|uniref:Ankyrin repeat and sterile alpha motif domain-containing protein 1B n=1 Tax=Symbiodinium microadriaticum TaxID=2951 RepID=A0A1Q9DEW2_SYMMI|nr:Ankyrin repeat and sterile alpha motif domain-containing protein 1B [Symbiodinium microadriaticum]
MACSGTSLTPLAQYAKSLQTSRAEGAPMHFPMYTVPLDTLLEMTKVEPHEVLKAKDMLVDFQRPMGKAAFVSHQWVAPDHPDPEFKQMRVLQEALKEMKNGNLQSIPVELVSEAAEGHIKPLPTSRLLSEPLFFWYDYFSCPQKDRLSRSMTSLFSPEGESGSKLLNAINSIPAYVQESSFFFALVPVLENPRSCNLITPLTWQSRGWCRLERTCGELSQQHSCIMVKSPKDVELIAGTCAFLRAGCGPVGEGVFTVPQDRLKLGPVLVAALKRRMLRLLKAQDLPGYRALLNQQHLLLRGMNPEADVQPFLEMEEDPFGSGLGDSTLVTTFFQQNGFRSVREIDSGGWSPLHYAALKGDPLLVEDLLKIRADPNQGSKKVHPAIGQPSGTPPLSIACIFKNNEAAKLLLSAKARVASRMFVRGPFNCAAHANNTEAIQILCQAGCSPAQTNVFGVSVMDGAAYHGALEAINELLSQSTASALNPTSALYNAAMGGGSADVVHRLLEMRANVNAQTDEHWKRTAMIRTLYKVKVLQHRLGKVTMVSKILYHAKGATPLMIALLTGQTAADFLQGHSVPEFLREAFEGLMSSLLSVTKFEERRPLVSWSRRRAPESGGGSLRCFSEPVSAMMSRWSALLCWVLSQTVTGDLNTQVSRNLRQGNLSAGNQSQSSSRDQSKGLRVANQTSSANGSFETAEAAFPILEAHPLLPPNVSIHMEAGTSPSNFTPVAALKSASGWVGCWYYGCRGSYHPEFYCQCNSGCTRYRNCCWDYGKRCGWQRPPPDGHCGGAIYFAMSPEATKTKAIGDDSKSGCVIEAKVDVGRVKYESANCGHKWNKQEFLGYDSIRFDPGDGDEVVIFDSWRVKSMRGLGMDCVRLARNPVPLRRA